MNRSTFVRGLRCRLFTAFLPLAWLLVAGSGCGPVWLLDPGYAERLAREENRPLLFYFKAWDSTQHRNMKLRVFEDSAVKQELMDTVNVELEFAWSDPYKTRYGVQRPQVCVMCGPNGKMVSSALYTNPIPSPEAFLAWLKRSKAEATPAPPTTTSAPAK